jgi:hypothetical protein
MCLNSSGRKLLESDADEQRKCLLDELDNPPIATGHKGGPRPRRGMNIPYFVYPVEMS